MQAIDHMQEFMDALGPGWERDSNPLTQVSTITKGRTWFRASNLMTHAPWAVIASALNEAADRVTGEVIVEVGREGEAYWAYCVTPDGEMV